jgi:hypothetical protein
MFRWDARTVDGDGDIGREKGAGVVVGLASGARESGEAGSLRVISVRDTEVSYLIYRRYLS